MTKDKKFSFLGGTYLILFVLFIVIIAASPAPKQPTRAIKTVVIVANSSSLIKHYIESYSKVGYRVQALTSQGVSYTPYSNGVYGGYHDTHTLYGDIILVMEK